MIYDFIIVGSGPAGASLASRLAKSQTAPEVLLLEAGQTIEASNPSLLFERFTSFMQYPHHNWGYYTVPQKGANDRKIEYARGKGLGGSSLINMCAWTVGPKDDYIRWAEETGDDAFNWEHAVRLRKKMESFDYDLSNEYRPYANPDMAVHGTDGPIRIEYPKIWERPIMFSMDAAKANGLGINGDANSGDPLGLSALPSTSRKGRRVTAATAYLSDVPDNLHIVTEAQVTKVLFDGKKAVGIIADGNEYRANHDIVLSAGAVDTPKLLMLSGIGDSKHLTENGIESIHHLPAVGQNLEDHYFAVTVIPQKAGLVDWPDFFTNPEKVKEAYTQFEKDGSGPLSIFYNGVALGFFKADDIMDTEEFKALPKNMQKHIQRPTVPMWEISTHFPAAHPSADPAKTYLSTALFYHNPASRGTIRLTSSSPKDPPLIDPNFLSHPFDQRAAKIAATHLRKWLSTPLIADSLVPNVPALSHPGETDESAIEWWRANGVSSYHPACTVKMGRKGDPEAGVDSDFRVQGVENLRVVDMSVAPFLPNCHLVAIAYWLGELAAEKMIKEYALEG